MLKTCSFFLPSSSRMIMKRLPWQLKARCWRSEKSMDKKSFLRERTRLTKKFMAAGRYKVAPVPIRFQKKIEVEIKETEEEKEKNMDKGKKEEKKFKIEIVEEVRTMPAILQEKGRVSKTPVLRKPYFTPGFGPLALKYGSIVMGKSLKTGLVAYNEDKFQEFCDMVSDALQKKENVTLVIKDWGKDEIPKEYMIVLPNNNFNHTIQ